jgi:glycosyltransferase involved in cell wall biosynthesis
MNDAHSRYSAKEHQRFATETKRGAVAVANILERWLDIRSVLDLGCGTGIWLNVLLDGGRRQGFGVDVVANDPADLEVDPELILNADLGQKLDLHRRYDLVVCLEVAEHIDAQFAEIVVDNCVRHADLILFSAALPGQQGMNHINEQPLLYWVERFQRHGYTDLDLIRPLIWNDQQIPVWYRQNMLLFVKNGSIHLEALRARANTAWTSPLAVAHPEYMQWFSTQAQTAKAEAERLQAELVQIQNDLTSTKIVHDTALANARAALAHADTALANTHATLVNARSEIARLQWERGLIVGSTLWRAMEPLRRLGRAMSPSRRQQMRRLVRALRPTRRRSILPEDYSAAQHHRTTLSPPPASSVAPHSDLLATLDPASSVAASATRRILFVSGEAHTPGHIYRVMRHVEAAAQLGMAASWMTIAQVWERGEDISAADIVIIWRAEDSPMVAEIFSRARATGAKVLFDIDDLMFKPELATISIIDGIRSLGHDAASVAMMFQSIQKVAAHADACICTTEELAHHMREFNPITFVLPNGFDAAALSTSRRAVRRCGRDSDGLVRLGYATGTRTHQADFRVAADAIGRILRERPQCRLVLFRDPAYQTPIMDAAEFPAMAGLDGQIEWRDAVSLWDLPNELARFDINLAPLEVGNPFCEAKSELKYFEAALVEVCTIASPTDPMRLAIHDGKTGRLAASTDAWYVAMLELVDDPTLRRTLAHAAYLDVLWQFGPQRRMAALTSILQQMEGPRRGAIAFELDLRRRADTARPEFNIPESEQIFISDQDGLAEVTVIVPVYNYARYVVEALDSVLHQTVVRLDLVVVDDASTDDSLAIIKDWAQRHANRFNRLVVMRNRRNSGLARTRNVGFDTAETPFVLPLDADNRLRPECCAKCLEALRTSQAAFAYPSLQCFGHADHLMAAEPFSAIRFAAGNYIDAMALIGKFAWAAVGGYAHIPYGWEDYDFWCRCIEHGFWGQPVPEILAEYRLHGASMLHTKTDIPENKLRVIEQLKARHGWLSIPHDG